MRLRNVKNAKDIVNNNPYVLNNPEKYKGNFQQIFSNNHPINLEIGMGKGDFIIGMALKYPEINFIGIEKYDSPLVSAVKKLESLKLNNLKLICFDAFNISDVFDHEIDKIYLNAVKTPI